MRHIVWFSCGAASAVTSMIVNREHPECQLVYCDTGGEHEDNKRFLADCEKYIGKEVIILNNEKYTDHFDCIEKVKMISAPKGGAPCTVRLKKELRFKFQEADDIQYFGYTTEEKDRADRFCKAFPEVYARFPLIENEITKEQCIGLIEKAGIVIPKMYLLGFRNNNCIGCVKGGKGYWNKIRVHFPEHFKKMSEIERSLGHTVLKKVYLDELKPGVGRYKEIPITCDFVCQSMEIKGVID